MKRYAKALGAVALALVLALFATPASAAQAGEAEGNVGFFVRPLLPDNQREGNHGYFDLRMQPGQVQQLAVEVFNQTDREMTVEVRAITASSGRHGAIDYITPDVRDESLFCAFSDIAELEQGTLTVPPLGGTKAVVTVSMPEAVFDGVVLGGLVFTKPLEQPDGSGDSSAVLGASIQNRYSYVVGVVLNETDAPVQPDFEVHTVQPEVVNHRVAPVHYIRNKNAAIVKGLALSIQLLREGEMFMEVEEQQLDMAPCSVMPFAPTAPENRLPAGQYLSKIELRLDGRTWRFEKSFTITGAEANRLNSGLAGEPDGLPLWAVLLIAALAVAVAGLVFAVLYQRRAQNRPESEKAGHTHKKN